MPPSSEATVSSHARPTIIRHHSTPLTSPPPMKPQGILRTSKHTAVTTPSLPSRTSSASGNSNHSTISDRIARSSQQRQQQQQALIQQYTQTPLKPTKESGDNSEHSSSSSGSGWGGGSGVDSGGESEGSFTVEELMNQTNRSTTTAATTATAARSAESAGTNAKSTTKATASIDPIPESRPSVQKTNSLQDTGASSRRGKVAASRSRSYCCPETAPTGPPRNHRAGRKKSNLKSFSSHATNFELSRPPLDETILKDYYYNENNVLVPREKSQPEVEDDTDDHAGRKSSKSSSRSSEKKAEKQSGERRGGKKRSSLKPSSITSDEQNKQRDDSSIDTDTSSQYGAECAAASTPQGSSSGTANKSAAAKIASASAKDPLLRRCDGIDDAESTSGLQAANVEPYSVATVALPNASARRSDSTNVRSSATTSRTRDQVSGNQKPTAAVKSSRDRLNPAKLDDLGNSSDRSDSEAEASTSSKRKGQSSSRKEQQPIALLPCSSGSDTEEELLPSKSPSTTGQSKVQALLAKKKQVTPARKATTAAPVDAEVVEDVQSPAAESKAPSRTSQPPRPKQEKDSVASPPAGLNKVQALLAEKKKMAGTPTVSATSLKKSPKVTPPKSSDKSKKEEVPPPSKNDDSDNSSVSSVSSHSSSSDSSSSSSSSSSNKIKKISQNGKIKISASPWTSRKQDNDADDSDSDSTDEESDAKKKAERERAKAPPATKGPTPTKNSSVPNKQELSRAHSLDTLSVKNCGPKEAVLTHSLSNLSVDSKIDKLIESNHDILGLEEDTLTPEDITNLSLFDDTSKSHKTNKKGLYASDTDTEGNKSKPQNKSMLPDDDENDIPASPPPKKPVVVHEDSDSDSDSSEEWRFDLSAMEAEKRRANGDQPPVKMSQERLDRLNKAKERIAKKEQEAERNKMSLAEKNVSTPQEQARPAPARANSEGSNKSTGSYFANVKRPGSIEQRRELAYQWYTRCGMPNQKSMKERIKKIQGCDICEEDVDLLPWMKGGFIVNVGAMMRHMAGK